MKNFLEAKFVMTGALSPWDKSKDDFDPWQKDGMTEDLDHLLQRALFIKERSLEADPGNFKIDYFSLLLAFIISDDPFSKWFQEYVRRVDVSIEDILVHKELDPERFNEIRKLTLMPKLSGKPDPLSSNANVIIREATKIMQETIGKKKQVLDVRHIMGSYIYAHTWRDDQLKKWGLFRKDWSSAFIKNLNLKYKDEIEDWTDKHRNNFGNIDPDPGPSAHISTDTWTLDDMLGYSDYARAIARFLTDPHTQPPLCISIQAPWGGGKTSLMRMVQDELDPEAIKKFPKTSSEEVDRKSIVDLEDEKTKLEKSEVDRS